MTYNNKYSQKVYEVLVPLVGDIMAQNVIKTQAKKIGKDENTITLTDMPKLAEAIRVGLIIFVGSDAARNISTNISFIK